MSFIDGKPYRSLKRHLTSQGMTPAEYRQKFGLPHDYPMVAASYAAQRSALAKSLGLGQRRRDAAAAAREEALQEAAQEAPRAEAVADEAAPEKPRPPPVAQGGRVGWSSPIPGVSRGGGGCRRASGCCCS